MHSVWRRFDEECCTHIQENMEKRGMHVHPETSPTKWASTHSLGFPALTADRVSFPARHYSRMLACSTEVEMCTLCASIDAFLLVQQ